VLTSFIVKKAMAVLKASLYTREPMYLVL